MKNVRNVGFDFWGYVPDEYFCDRVYETAKLIKCVGNQTNVLLTSPLGVWARHS